MLPEAVRVPVLADGVLGVPEFHEYPELPVGMWEFPDCRLQQARGKTLYSLGSFAIPALKEL